jgi:PTS system nitrogen regulatory IIA component
MLVDHLSSERVLLEGHARDKKGVLRELAVALSASEDDEAVQEVLAGLTERENVMSTGIGHGIAIPHARLAGAVELKLALVRYPAGIDFEALDNKPVYAAFGVVGPPEGTGQHVKLLARIARLVKETGALDEVLGAPDVDGVLAILERRDR